MAVKHLRFHTRTLSLTTFSPADTNIEDLAIIVDIKKSHHHFKY